MSALENLTPEERIARKVDALIGARARAAEASRCPKCGHPATLAVKMAEDDLIQTVEREYRAGLVSA